MGTMSTSISFDRAAEFYDATRGFPPGVAEQVAGALARRIAPGSPVLEVGIGTGRIAIPLATKGYSITGVDLSWNMLQKLKENYQAQSPQQGSTSPAVAQADATRLPFHTAQFEAVLAVHVLHLIPDWQQALVEIQRVLKPGGSLFVGHTWRASEAPRQALRRVHAEILRSFGYASKRYVSRDMQETDQALKATGARGSEIVAAEWESTSTPDQDIESLNQRIWSSTWDIPDEVYQKSIQKLSAWASEHYGSLDTPHSSPQRFIWRQYHW
jgi:ubiquinone/menaquinone biosynthesis C-methylase UbiE